MADEKPPKTDKVDPEIVRLASVGLFGEIGALARKLDETPVSEMDPKEREKLEHKLEDLFVTAVDEFPSSVSGLLTPKTYKRYIDRQRVDDNAERGVVAPSTEFAEWALKIKEKSSGLEPHQAHIVNVSDYEHFNRDEHRRKIAIARILDPIKVIDPYVMLRDRFSASEERRKSFVQVQQYIPGQNLYELFVFLRSLQQTADIEAAERSLLGKCFRDIFYWHRNAPAMPGIEADPERIIQQYVRTIEDAIENASRYTDCTVDKLSPEELAAIKESIIDVLPKRKEDYSRILDSTPANIILVSGLEKLTKDTLKQAIGQMMSENIVHVDLRERYGHVAEDLFSLSDSKALGGTRMGEDGFSMQENSREYHELMKRLSEGTYTTSMPAEQAIGIIRALRLRDFNLSPYARRIYTTRDTRTNYEEDLRGYKKSIRHHDERAIAHQTALAEMAEAAGNPAASRALRRLSQITRQMSDFNQFIFDRK